MDGHQYIGLEDHNRSSLESGLGHLGDEFQPKHPVEKIQAQGTAWEAKDQYEALRNMYGSALPARRHIERQILERNPRLPPFQTSNISYEAYSGQLGTFGFESYLGLPEMSTAQPVDTHAQMECKLNLRESKPTRGFF